MKSQINSVILGLELGQQKVLMDSYPENTEVTHMNMPTVKTQDLERNLLAVEENHALDILVNLSTDQFKQLETQMAIAGSDTINRNILGKFIALCQRKGVNLSEAAVTAFKETHGLGNSGVLRGVIGAQTATVYFDVLTSSGSASVSTRDRQINDAGLQLVMEFEGYASREFRSGEQVPNGNVTAYIDPVGVPTIGFGHTLTVTASDVDTKIITRQAAEQLLRQDLAEAETAVNRLITVPLTDNQFSSLVSFTFNLGEGALADSTLRKLLNAKDYQGAADQFLRWVNGDGQVLPGLVRRREAEQKLFLS